MQMLIRVLLKDKILYIAIACTLLIAYLSLTKLQPSVVEIDHLDKFEHTFSYAVLTLAWLLGLVKTIENKKLQYSIGLACMFYGIVIEVLQGTVTTYRSASYLDVLANFVGVIIALAIFKTVFKKFNAI